MPKIPGLDPLPFQDTLLHAHPPANPSPTQGPRGLVSTGHPFPEFCSHKRPSAKICNCILPFCFSIY